MKCKTCNCTVTSHKKRLKHYGYCLNCLPSQYRCNGVKANKTKCHYAKLKGKDYCSRHYRYSTTNKSAGSKYGYVYIMSLGFDNMYKIGSTKNPQRRLTALRASNPRLEIRYKKRVSNMGYVESECHRQLTPYWVEREIFKLNDDFLQKAIELIIALDR